jgi:UDPglucose 6-dehydrogenase
MEEAHAVAVLTEWDAFRDLEWESVYKGMLQPAFVFDRRSVLDAEALRGMGFKACVIGDAR